MKKGRIIAVLFVLTYSVGFSQTQLALYDASLKAYERKDYKTFLRQAITLDSLRPLHPTYTYNLASAYALNDNPEGALSALTQLVLMDCTLAFETDEDFKSIQQDEGFRSVIKLKENQRKTIATSKSVVVLSENQLHPEGVTYLPKLNIWLASSIRKRKIVAFDRTTGQCTDWLKGNQMLSVLAMKPDLKEHYLWVATAAFPEMEQYTTAMKGKAEILKVSIATKQIMNRFTVAGTAVFGDLVVAKNGVVYVSDSVKPIIYKIENNQISEFISLENEGYNLQGLAFNDSQTKLFVADYLKGIVAINVQTKSKNWFVFPDTASPKGIDGLVFYKNTLIAIQNGVKPIRVSQFELNVMQQEISSFKILDSNRPEFNEPTLATVVEGQLYFFGNSPWKAYDEKGVLDATKVSNPVLYSCTLK